MRENFWWKCCPGINPSIALAMLCILFSILLRVNPLHPISFSKEIHIVVDARNVKGITPSGLVQPVQSIKKHLLVAVFIDDSRQGIEDQMDPSSFASCQTISCLTAQPFTFSLVVTPYVLPIFCSNLNHLSEYGFACLAGQIQAGFSQ